MCEPNEVGSHSTQLSSVPHQWRYVELNLLKAEWARQERQKQQDIKSFYGYAYQPPPGRVIPKDFKTGLPRLTPRRRSPIHTRFKREEATVKRDQEARQLRSLGLSYQEIADYLGYSSRQVAWDAVKRGQRDYLNPPKKRGRPQSRTDKVPASSEHSRPSPFFWREASSASRHGNARGRVFPPVG